MIPVSRNDNKPTGFSDSLYVHFLDALPVQFLKIHKCTFILSAWYFISWTHGVEDTISHIRKNM